MDPAFHLPGQTDQEDCARSLGPRTGRTQAAGSGDPGICLSRKLLTPCSQGGEDHFFFSAGPEKEIGSAIHSPYLSVFSREGNGLMRRLKEEHVLCRHMGSDHDD